LKRWAEIENLKTAASTYAQAQSISALKEQIAERKEQHRKNPDAYLRSHESQLILYDGARNVLRKSGINLKSLDVDKMRSEYRRMSDTRKELRNSQKALDREVADLEKKLQTLNAYLGQEPSEHQQAKQPAHRRGIER
jgi:malate/lactate dehydrogenase